MKRSYLVLFTVLGLSQLQAQTDSTKQKRKFSYYATWGYNRESYTTSTIHFKNEGTLNGVDQYGPYDFVVKDVKAHDRPDFDGIKDVINITIPQFSMRFGFWLNNKNDEGFEINYDHAKYVVTEGQMARFTGNINGVWVDKDSIIDSKYFHFEHTDGANFWMINYMKRNKIYYSKNIKFGYVIKPGVGIVFPRTDVTLFGERVNNDWKLAGVCAGMETALRAEFFRHFLIEFAGKAGWANYMNCFVLGKNGIAKQKFGFIEGILSIGYQFTL